MCVLKNSLWVMLTSLTELTERWRDEQVSVCFDGGGWV